MFYWLSLETSGTKAGMVPNGTVAGWLATGHTLLLAGAYYWITRVLYPTLLQQRWLSASGQTLGLYLLTGLGTYWLYQGVGGGFLVAHTSLYQSNTPFKQAAAVAAALGHDILLPNWWLYSLLVTAVSLKIVRDAYQTKTQALQLEMNLLRSQINPHFLFNTLNNIYSLVEAKDVYAAEILLKFGDIMRYTLYESNTNFIALQQEITMLKDYIELEQIRHDVTAPATIQFDEPGENYESVIPPLLLITLVENAFKHGIQATIGSSWVTMRLEMDEHQLHFQVSNNKPPVPSVRATRHKINVHRVGLDNIRRRLQLLYPNDHVLTIADQVDCFTVQLIIPKHGPSSFLPGH
ncbi:sensor histidine kinase [Spirosoma validum]|uniref:Histidine kinase n=1 Tax=Spirosoma validum TaxID=2771355 RepID=A0A927B4J4_9BACT|nr:histidine kinase [Spirosoma validum]MBD2755264.1 histidine kinase [Spirosoma validum]